MSSARTLVEDKWQRAAPDEMLTFVSLLKSVKLFRDRRNDRVLSNVNRAGSADQRFIRAKHLF